MKVKKYSERLHVGTDNIEDTQKIRGDLIETFKILTSREENVDSEIFFQLADSSRHTRGHRLKTLYKTHCRLDVRKFFFSQRVVNEQPKVLLFVKGMKVKKYSES